MDFFLKGVLFSALLMNSNGEAKESIFCNVINRQHLKKK